MSLPAAHAHTDQALVRRNFLCHLLEGGFYMGGLAFLSPESVMPKMAETLGARPSLIALMPALLPAAFALLGVFVAPFVERLDRHKPWVLVFGLLQRLPYLVTGLILLLAPEIDDRILPIVVLTPVISGVIGGVGVVAWMEMVTRMVPERLRAAGWAARYIMQAGIGMGAGGVIHSILTHHPGREGYGWLHLITFGFLALSWLSQLPMREAEPLEPTASGSIAAAAKTPLHYSAYLASLPGLIVSQPHLLKFIFVRFTGMGYLMLFGFLTVHALQVTHRAEADEGIFVSFQNVGTILGCTLAGWLGYRSGGKILLLAARLLCVLVCAWVAFAQSFLAFTTAYFLLGFGLFIDRVGDLTLAAELCPPARRATLQAVLGFCNVGAVLAATSLAGVIYQLSGRSFPAVATTAAAFASISALILRLIPEPRAVIQQTPTPLDEQP
jgi:MFS family permease